MAREGTFNNVGLKEGEEKKEEEGGEVDDGWWHLRHLSLFTNTIIL